MKISITLLFLILCFNSKAQVNEGIKFEKGLNWTKIKEKAKKENKYIFIDTYTTWCGPCKQMEIEIFPQENVRDFFNKNFINVKVQIDRTKKDNKQVKLWYNDAKLIEETYKISLYPTYLFLNSNGNLVHEIKGGSNSSEEFINKASAALNPKTQYYNLKKEFENGNRDTTFLKLLITTASSTYDLVNAKIYTKCYLKAQTNLLSPKNIEYIASSLETSQDIGYDIILKRPKEVIPIIGEQYRDYILNTIAFDEDILPMLRINGKKENVGNMISYTGKINSEVDWKALELMLNSKYVDRAPRLILEAKTSYYKWSSDLNNLNKVLIDYTRLNTNPDQIFLCNWLNYYILIDKTEYFSDALKWANAITTSTKNFSCIKNYGLMLYKAGQKEEAIKVILDYKIHWKEPEKDLEDLINKMKSGNTIY